MAAPSEGEALGASDAQGAVQVMSSSSIPDTSVCQFRYAQIRIEAAAVPVPPVKYLRFFVIFSVNTGRGNF